MKIKRLALAIIVGGFSIFAAVVAIILLVSGIQCVKDFLTGGTPTSLEWLGLGFISLCAGIVSAVWFYLDTRYDDE